MPSIPKTKNTPPKKNTQPKKKPTKTITRKKNITKNYTTKKNITKKKTTKPTRKTLTTKKPINNKTKTIITDIDECKFTNFCELIKNDGKFTIKQLKDHLLFFNQENNTNHKLVGKKDEIKTQFLNIICGENQFEDLHFVYVIKSMNPDPKYKNRTYVGYSKYDPSKRLHNHNNRKCGARYTKIGRPYEVFFYVKGFCTTGYSEDSHALQFEKRCQYPNGWRTNKKGKLVRKSGPVGRGYRGIEKRIKILEHVLSLPKCTSESVLTKDYPLTIVFMKNNLKMKCPSPHTLIYYNQEVKPNNTELNNTEPNNIEPNNTEPNNTEPNNTDKK